MHTSGSALHRRGDLHENSRIGNPFNLWPLSGRSPAFCVRSRDHRRSDVHAAHPKKRYSGDKGYLLGSCAAAKKKIQHKSEHRHSIQTNPASVRKVLGENEIQRACGAICGHIAEGAGHGQRYSLLPCLLCSSGRSGTACSPGVRKTPGRLCRSLRRITYSVRLSVSQNRAYGRASGFDQTAEAAREHRIQAPFSRVSR